MDLASDTYTGPQWQPLPAHAPEFGGPIVKHPTAGGDWYLVNDRAVCRAPGLVYYAVVPASADYVVEADVVAFSGVGATGVAGRIDPTSSNFYYLYIKQGNGELVLAKMVNGVPTTLDVEVMTFGASEAGTVHRLRLTMAGTSLLGYVNGVPYVSATDSTHSAIGRGGIRAPAISDTTTGKHVDNLLIWDATSPPVTAATAGYARVVGL